MNVKKLVVLAMCLLVVMGIVPLMRVSALEVKITNVKITTEPLRSVEVVFYEKGTETVIQRFDEKSYTEGVVEFKFYSIQSTFDYEVVVKFGDDEIASEKKEGHSAGNPIDLTLGADSSEEGTTEDSTETTDQAVTADEGGNTQNAVSGAAVVGGDSKSIGNYWYFIAAGVLALGVLGFLAKRKIYASQGINKGNFVPPKTIQRSVDPSKPVVSQQTAQEKSSNELEKRISDAESRIKEAQSELRKIKEDEKIKFAERKLQKDMEELNKLKKQQDKI